MKDVKKLLKHAPTLLLKIAIIGLGVVVLLLSAILLPNILLGWPTEYPQLPNLQYPLTIGIGLTIIPFLFALYQGLKLLKYIDKNTAFSNNSVTALQNIKFAAVVISTLYIAMLPVVFNVAQVEDAPGMILVWSALFVGSPLVIALLTAVMQRLLQNVIDIKSENDLTV